MGDFISLSALDGAGSFDAYCAPVAGAKAGIVVIQEIFGVNPGIQSMVDAWAAEGYTAIAPDLFWRLAPRTVLNPDRPEEFQQALGLMGRFDTDKGLDDIRAAVAALRAQGCAKVGIVGYCLGGRLAYLYAARGDGDAAVGYYGVGLDGLLDEQSGIGKPLMLHIATRDKFVPAEAQRKIHAALADNTHVTLYDYDADHAFARAVGHDRVPELADLADHRTREFFRVALS